MKHLMKKILIFMIIYSGISKSQNLPQQIINPKDYVIFNGLGEQSISRTLNGWGVYLGFGFSQYNIDLLNEASKIPIFISNHDASFLAFSFSYFYNPIDANLSFSYALINLKKIKRNFAFPPFNPDGKSPSYKISNYDYSLTINYIVSSFFDNLFFLSSGFAFYGGLKEHMNYYSHFFSIGYNVSIYAKYSFVMTRFSYQNSIINRNYSGRLFRAEIGIWLN